jgi:DNA-binding NarL/FixJ family response regulator
MGEFWLDRRRADIIRRLAKRQGPTPAPVQVPNPRNRISKQGATLSQRERGIVALVAQGFKNKMARQMFISEQTVKNRPAQYFRQAGRF